MEPYLLLISEKISGTEKKSHFFFSRNNMSKPSEDSVHLDLRQRNTSGTSVSSTQDSLVNDEDRDREKKLLKKLDWRIVPWIFCLYFLSVEDRSNVGYAMTMNKAEKHTLADTAGLTPQQNNIGLGLFYVAYIVSYFL